ncbi:MAG: Dabb family protein [Pirellulales bacterium]|nr:Dabb family protein [Pirellulales bacterium]
MKRTVLVVSLALVVGLGVILPTVAQGPTKAKAKNPQLGKLRHAVMLQFKEGTTPDQIKTIESEFCKLPTKIPEIVAFEWGTNNSEEGLSEGLTHCFLITFDDVKGRDAYLPHEAHKAFVAILRPHLEKVVVVDYVVKE